MNFTSHEEKLVPNGHKYVHTRLLIHLMIGDTTDSDDHVEFMLRLPTNEKVCNLDDYALYGSGTVLVHLRHLVKRRGTDICVPD
jgi:hypothetical protein